MPNTCIRACVRKENDGTPKQVENPSVFNTLRILDASQTDTCSFRSSNTERTSNVQPSQSQFCQSFILIMYNHLRYMVSLVLYGLCCSAFHTSRFSTSLRSANDNESEYELLSELKEKATNKAIIEKLLCGKINEEESSLVELNLVGRGDLGPDGSSTECIFLARKDGSENSSHQKEFFQTLPLPLPSSASKNIIKLLSFAYRAKPISKSLCLTLNPLLVNRDGALFDNLPFSKWTIDPLRKNRDAAQNPIADKFHLGKRDAFNRFMGKDWYGRSLSVGNVAARAKYMLEKDEPPAEQVESSSVTLAQRVLELEVKESRMALAEAEEQYAIMNAKFGSYNLDEISDDLLVNSYDEINNRMQSVQDAKDSLLEREEALSNMMSLKGNLESDSFLSKILSAIVESKNSDAPYRGAIGYNPIVDSKEEMFEKSVLPYSSPFEMMKEIINEQLNADIIGCIIEDTSLFTGSTIFGGGVIIKRRGRGKKLILNGEEVEFDDDEDDYGNDGLRKGEVALVECDSDEAIGMGLASGVGIFIECSEWEKSRIEATAIFQKSEGEGIMDSLPSLKNSIASLTIARQGDGETSENTNIQTPRATDRDFTSLIMSNDENIPVFETKIPVQSLSEFDGLTIQDKAQLLLSLDSFKGELPRPRLLKLKGKDNGLDPLDKKLLPLIDESVRRQVLVREAEARGDFDKVNELEGQKSKRQIAKENAEIAREEGNSDLAAIWEKEAELYSTLRADATQDEGSYSSFLDRDDWYERTRRKIAEKNNKKLRNLLDGFE